MEWLDTVLSDRDIIDWVVHLLDEMYDVAVVSLSAMNENMNISIHGIIRLFNRIYMDRFLLFLKGIFRIIEIGNLIQN